MLEIWELIIGRQLHNTGKDGGHFERKPRPDKGCSTTDDDDDDDMTHILWYFFLALY
jgi:hypothetical protein